MKKATANGFLILDIIVMLIIMYAYKTEHYTFVVGITIFLLLRIYNALYNIMFYK